MKTARWIARTAVGIALLLPLLAVSVSFAATNDTGAKKSSTSKTSTSDDSKSAAGGGSVQGFAADSALEVGTIVQLTAKDANKVTAATNKNMNQMFGVVVDPHLLSLTLSSDNLSNESFVATSGTYKVLVSNEGGTINVGDFVTLSAINGVGMKAGTEEPVIFGRAVGSFTGKNGIGQITLKDTTGATAKTVTLGSVQVSINIQRNPNKKSTKADLPKLLQRIGEAVAEKPIGPLRIYLSLIITGLSIIIAITVLYSGIRNSIISIGRNPLSKKAIFRGLLEIILTSFLILIIGLFAVYLLLKL
jgi:hypothetical protein